MQKRKKQNSCPLHMHISKNEKKLYGVKKCTQSIMVFKAMQGWRGIISQVGEPFKEILQR